MSGNLPFVGEVPLRAEYGHIYQTACVLWRNGKRTFWVPVIGPAHADPELNNPDLHCHVDVRFASDNLLRVITGIERYDPSFAPVVNAKDVADCASRPVWCCRSTREPMFSGRLLCTHHSLINGMHLYDFEHAYKDKRVIERDGCQYCPHRGLPLALGTPVGTEDEIECPGHGLVWNIRTGKLVRRAVLPQC